MLINKSTQAASSIAGIFPQIAGAAAGLTALGVLAGWREASAYYSELGAPWFLSSIAPIMFLERSANTMLTIALLAIISISLHMQKRASAKGLRRASIAAMVVSIFLFCAGLLPESIISIASAHLCTVLGSFALSISAGLMVGEVSARLADDKLIWNGYHIWLLCFVVWFGLMFAPNRIGESQAKLDRDCRISKLPTARLMADTLGKQFRMVALAGSHALLVALADQPSKNQFRVVEVSDIALIGRAELQNSPVRP